MRRADTVSAHPAKFNPNDPYGDIAAGEITLQVVSMKDTLIYREEIIEEAQNGILLTGLPGIGLIGQVVGRYLVDAS